MIAPSPRLRSYLDGLVAACERAGSGVASVLLFGSATRGGFSDTASDVDLLVVLADGASGEDRRRMRGEVARLEAAHGFGAPRARPRGALPRLVERSLGGGFSGFVCTRADLLSGDVARVLDLRPAEALLVDRIVLASILESAVTVWGEDLLPRVPIPPVRRLDVVKATFSFTCQLLLGAAVYPFVPDVTRLAMGTLKRSLHSCYYCYHLGSAPLEEEVAFFGSAGASRALRDLLALRGRYRRSFAFVLRCIPAVLGLHARTIRDNRFPRVRPAPAAVA